MAKKDGTAKGGNSRRPYSGYFPTEVPRPDDELSRVGPGTPMGEYMRRFWQPLCLSEELKDLPKASLVLGEELVVFRDKADRIGVLHKHCSHRGTSLEYGTVSDRGIRCCYHGWLYDVDGTILETPGEPPNSKLKRAFFPRRLSGPGVQGHRFYLPWRAGRHAGIPDPRRLGRTRRQDGAVLP